MTPEQRAALWRGPQQAKEAPGRDEPLGTAGDLYLAYMRWTARMLTDYDKIKRGECPACGDTQSDIWTSREDAVHDVVLGCKNCGVEFGLQLAAFWMVERIT